MKCRGKAPVRAHERGRNVDIRSPTRIVQIKQPLQFVGRCSARAAQAWPCRRRLEPGTVFLTHMPSIAGKARQVRFRGNDPEERSKFHRRVGRECPRQVVDCRAGKIEARIKVPYHRGASHPGHHYYMIIPEYRLPLSCGPLVQESARSPCVGDKNNTYRIHYRFRIACRAHLSPIDHLFCQQIYILFAIIRRVTGKHDQRRMLFPWNILCQLIQRLSC